jgi:hypothetical protein
MKMQNFKFWLLLLKNKKIKAKDVKEEPAA